MSKIIEIYFDDLIKEKQEEILAALNGDNGNWDIFPMFEMEIMEDKE